MDQLKFKDLVKLFDELRKEYSIEEIMEMPVYIGDDEELNGVHKSFRCEPYTEEEYFAEGEKKFFKGKIILIS